MESVVDQTIVELDTRAAELKPECQVAQTMTQGQAIWQGDVGVQFLGSDRPAGLNLVSAELKTQLADGDRPGSRHCLEDSTGIEAFELRDSVPVIGQVLHAPKGLRVVHPEHATIGSDQPGWYVVRYQVRKIGLGEAVDAAAAYRPARD